MTTYNEIAGRRVNFLSSDPTYVDTNSNGQVWYNSSTATLKSWLPTGAWSSGGSLNTARLGSGSAGTQTASSMFGGLVKVPAQSPTGATELYNGIAWTTSPATMGTARYKIAGVGTQTAALGFAGSAYPPAGPTVFNKSETESFNGTAWTAGGALPTAQNSIGGVGTQTAALAFGGSTYTPPANTTLKNTTYNYNGTSWTTSPATMNTARQSPGGAGTQTAALAFGGYTTAYSAATESYNGSAWTTVNSLNTARSFVGSAGTQTAALTFGGSNAPGVSAATELWNGTSWTSNPTGLSTARSLISGTGSQTAALGSGGETTTALASTEEWNFGVYSYTAAAWASGGNLNTARDALAGCGTQTASLAFGGFAAGNNSTSTEKYNGTSWTATGSLNTARRNISGFGIQTAAIAAGGASPGGNSNAAESFNGSTWTSVTSMNTARGRLAAANGSPQTAGLIFAGNTGPALSAATESWNGSSWTSVNSMNTGRNWPGGLGTQTAALAFGGNNYIGGGLTPTVYSATESWNGTSWTTVNSLNVPRYYPGGTGIQTAGLAFGGNGNGPSSGPFPLQTVTESYNGTSWTNLPNMTTARGGMASAGTQTAALGAGGYTTTAVATTEEWTGEVATATSKTLTTS
jgi:hypothetical protein